MATYWIGPANGCLSGDGAGPSVDARRSGRGRSCGVRPGAAWRAAPRTRGPGPAGRCRLSGGLNASVRAFVIARWKRTKISSPSSPRRCRSGGTARPGTGHRPEPVAVARGRGRARGRLPRRAARLFSRAGGGRARETGGPGLRRAGVARPRDRAGLTGAERLPPPAGASFAIPTTRNVSTPARARGSTRRAASGGASACRCGPPARSCPARRPAGRRRLSCCGPRGRR
jgi:hypothetical protein